MNVECDHRDHLDGHRRDRGLDRRSTAEVSQYDSQRGDLDHALAVGEHDDGKVLYLGPDRAGNLLEVVSVARDDGSEIVIHAMPMRSKYEPFLRGEGASDA